MSKHRRIATISVEPPRVKGMGEIFEEWYSNEGDELFRTFCDNKQIEIDRTAVAVVHGVCKVQHRVTK